MSAPDFNDAPRMDRRTAIKWLATALAAVPLIERGLTAAAAAQPGGRGYGTDPDLLKNYQAGDLWPLTFTTAQRATAAALCDVIIPQDEKGPSASAVKVPDFIDEWISAPYGEPHETDRRAILDGLAWLDREAQKRFSHPFTELIAGQKNAIADDICYAPKAKPEFRTPAHFFHRFRDLTAAGYYTTPEGMRDIGYTGNVAMQSFEVPREVLQKLGLA